MKRVTYFLIGLLLTGCAATIDYRGKQPEPEQLAKVKIGQNEEEVFSLIGSPTSTSLYGPKKWYYVYKKTAKTAFFEPNALEEQLVIISFNDQGKVAEVIVQSPDGTSIDPISYQTPTIGQDRPFLQQIFSNFGRYAKSADSKKQ
jgi:outer membrane protein assembly factor BamE (lipoprotein component of BamABCDE complex)